MKIYRVTLTLRSPSGSAWQADTVFGHLCWLLKWREGKAALDSWLERYRNNDPPFLLSDGFPGDLLPRPVPPPETQKPPSKQEGMKASDERKHLKTIEWLTLPEFEQVRAGNRFLPTLEGDAARQNLTLPQVTFKNQISRLTGTTGEEGQLYPFVAQVCWETVTLYVRIADEKTKATLHSLFDDLTATGYGKRKSVGYGEIKEWKWELFAGFPAVNAANAFVSLSHFVPAAKDPVDGQWRINIKYGKLGGELVAAGNPFKRPLVMLTPGSWFQTEQPEKEWYGRMVIKDIKPDHPYDIVQYGLAFAVPMKAI